MKKLIRVMLIFTLAITIPFSSIPAQELKSAWKAKDLPALEEYTSAFSDPLPRDGKDPEFGKDNAPEEDYGLIPDDPKEQGPDFESGVILIKFKEDAPVAAVASELLQKKQPFASITDSDSLDKLFKKHGIIEMTPVFKGFDKNKNIPKGQITKQAATQIKETAKADFSQKVNAINSKFSERASRAPQGAQAPYLGNIYKVKVAQNANIPAICKQFEEDPNVEYAQPNYEMQLYFQPNDPYYRSRGAWNQEYDDLYALKPDKLDCEHAWELAGIGDRENENRRGMRGAGGAIVVAVIDTGVDYNHQDIAANIWRNPGEIPGNNTDDDNNGLVDDIYGYDFSNNDNNPMDDHGHGTHCAGIIAAIGNNELGVIGVAPEAKIMAVKGLSVSGGSTAVLAGCIRYAADMGADVLSNSWGPSSSRPSCPVLESAVDYAYAAGCVVVFSAGNKNDDIRYYSPNNYSKVISVAATDYNDARARFSNWGAGIVVAAPGVEILSLKAAAVEGGNAIVDDNYLRATGTSMAGPHVAGVAALILSLRPGFTNEEVYQVIKASADDLGTEGQDIYFGYGRINANRALQIESVCIARLDQPNAFYNREDEGEFGRGVIEIRGAASGENFHSYTLAYKDMNDEDGNWVQIGGSRHDQQDRRLSRWDISELEGDFYLKLTVTDTDNNIFEDTKGPFCITFPHAISTLEELYNIRHGRSGIYYLANDIDASATRNWEVGDNMGFEPIGYNEDPFRGVFDGRGHVIRNLYIHPGEYYGYAGLFGCTAGAIIRNVGLVDVDMRVAVVAGVGYEACIGGLVAQNSENSIITNSYVTGIVLGNRYVIGIGGLVGQNSEDSIITDSYASVNVSGSIGNLGGIGGLVGINRNTITNSYATGSVSGDRNLGGLVGINRNTITNSYASGSVYGCNNAGGLVGVNSNTIANSYATGSVGGTTRRLVGYDDAANLGGLVGVNYTNSTITNSYATGSVSGGLYSGVRVGGLVGINYTNSTIANSYATGSVIGNVERSYSGNSDFIGGLVGGDGEGGPTIITNCYAIGSVTRGNSSVINRQATHVGGFVGTGQPGNYRNNYWNIETTGQAHAANGVDDLEGIQGLTTAQMMQENTYPHLEEGQEEGWDFGDGDDVWFMPGEWGCYPHLIIEESVHHHYFASQEINLNRGWNMISFYVEPDVKSMMDILQPMMQRGQLLLIRNDVGHFIAKLQNGTYINGNMTDMQVTEGYEINVSGNTPLTVSGRLVESPITTPLRQGWNMMSYPLREAQPVMNVLQQLVDARVPFEVRDYTHRLVYIRGQVPDVNWDFQPGQGYKIHVGRAVDLVINEP